MPFSGTAAPAAEPPATTGNATAADKTCAWLLKGQWVKKTDYWAPDFAAPDLKTVEGSKQSLAALQQMAKILDAAPGPLTLPALTQSVVTALHWQFEKGENPALKKLTKTLLQKREDLLRRGVDFFGAKNFQSIVKQESLNRSRSLAIFSLDLAWLKTLFKKSEKTLHLLRTTPQGLILPVDDMDALFFLKDLQKELFAADQGPLEDLGRLRTYDSEFARSDVEKRLAGLTLVGGVGFGEDRVGHLVHLIIVQMRLEEMKLQQSGLFRSSDALERSRSFLFASLAGRLRALNFSDFDRQYPGRFAYDETLYLGGAKNVFESSIIRKLFHQPNFKSWLFAQHPGFMADQPALRTRWLSWNSVDEVAGLLEASRQEDPRIVQILNSRLRSRTQKTIKELLAERPFLEIYADDVVEVLNVALSEQKERIRSAPLIEFLENRKGLQARFFSRVSGDLNLGNLTGDCTSLRSINFSNSLRWFANPASQVMTFSIDHFFAAKAHVVMLQAVDGQRVLVVDAFEINPQGQVDSPKHEIVTAHLNQMFEKLHELGSRMGMPVSILAQSNTEFVNDRIRQLPETSALLNVPVHFEQTRAQIVGPFVNAKKFRNGFFFLQSYQPPEDEEDDSRTSVEYLRKVQRIVGSAENNLRAGQLQANGIFPRAFAASRFADLPTQDPHLEQLKLLFSDSFHEFQAEHDMADAFKDLKRAQTIDDADTAAGTLADLLSQEDAYIDELARIYGFRPLLLDPWDETDAGEHNMLRDFLFHRLFYLYFYKQYEERQASSADLKLDGEWFELMRIYAL